MLLARRALRPSSTSFPLSKIITLPITASFISTTTTTTPTNLKMSPNNNNHNNNNKDTLQEGGRGGGGEEPHQYQSGNRTDRPEDEWKFRAPYKIHDKGEDFQVKWRGKCHCGAVQYELSREKPLASKYCHCTTCQRMHGAPFQWAAIFHKSDINFTNGHHDLGWYDPTAKSTTHHLPCKVQCAYCRTPIMDEGRNMILLFPTLIEGINSPEGKKAFEVQSHMFYPQRVVDIKDGKPKFKGLADETNLVDEETGEEVVGSNPKEKEKEKRKREEEEGKDGENGEKGGKREKKEE